MLEIFKEPRGYGRNGNLWGVVDESIPCPAFSNEGTWFLGNEFAIYHTKKPACFIEAD